MVIDVVPSKKLLAELLAEEGEIRQTLKSTRLKRGHQMRLETDLFFLRKEINKLI